MVPENLTASPALGSMLERTVENTGVAPAAVAGIAVFQGQWRVEVGAAGRSGSRLVEPGTPFDLASVTKPFFAVTLARLAREQRLSLQQPLEALLPHVALSPSAGVPLELFLAHRAGLEPHRTLFAPLIAQRSVERRLAIEAAANARNPASPGLPPQEGFAPLYSDLGYILLGEAVETVTGTLVDAHVRHEVSRPLELEHELGSARQWLARDPSFLERVAPTEHVQFRGGTVRGRVHDENAWALAGHGACGHAGLFGTARGVLGFGMAVLDALEGRRPDWLEPADLEVLVRERPGGTLRAGFDGKAAGRSAAGSQASPATFGHLGFTGTSLWIDPVAQAVSVLLTNRVLPTRANLRVRDARPEVQNALYQHMGLASA